MIRVNLLKNKAIVSNAALKASAAGDAHKPGLSKFSFSKSSSDLDKGFDTFECSPVAQFVKLVLLVGFIVPLVAYEKMRASSSESVISVKNAELQSYQTIKFDKERNVNTFIGLDEKIAKMKVRDQELLEIKENRLTALYGIDELQTAVPGDVWLTSIAFVDGDRIDVEGQTLLDSGLDRLLTALKESDRLTKVNIQQDIKTKSKKGKTLNEFKITMSVTKNSNMGTGEAEDGR